ncbi:MAG: von Willebrand factor, type [Bryobacterales bacterium]|nr:von Willebrand factor, type [Bryobacterales bacterium]
MRSFWAITLFCTALLPLTADDPVEKRADPKAPNVSIQPRVRPFPTGAGETILDRRADLRIDTTLVLVPVAVTIAATGKLLTGLDKDNFELSEDKVSQEIATFGSEDVPLSIGVVFDCSGSMGNKLDRSRQAVAQFMRTANPEDEFFLVQFNDRPELTVPFTDHPEDIQSHLTWVQSKGRTALLDGVAMAMNEMKKAHNGRKALLVISDGGDNSSRFTESEVRNWVREGDVQIYAIGIFEPIGARGRTPEEMSGPGLLNDLAEQTGGRHFAVDNLADLPDVAAKIGLELRNQYVLGYSPKNAAKDGKYRKVEVKLVKIKELPPLRARYRPGYVAPAK